jgi:TRAP-type C4-dicarboxylate transport system substrate-binding protein
MTPRQIACVAALAAVIVGASTAARAQEAIVLKFAYPGPLQSWPSVKGVNPWAGKIKEASGGLVEIQVFPNIATYRNVYDRILNGVTDFGFGTYGNLEDQFPRSTVTGLPLLADNSLETGLALWRMYASGVIAEEYGRVKPISMFGFGNSGFHMTKAVTALEDLKGMKVLAGGRSVSRIVTLIGAVPITTTPAEVYEGLNRGMGSGTVTTWSGIEQFKLGELIKYHLDMPFGRTGGYFFMNKDTFAKLPAKAREAIDRYSGEELTTIMSTEADRQDNADRDKVMARPDQTWRALSAGDMKAVERMLTPMIEEWVAATVDGPKVLAAYKAEVQRIRAK